MPAPKGKKHKYPKNRAKTKKRQPPSTAIRSELKEWRKKIGKESLKSVWLKSSKRTSEMIFSSPEVLLEEFESYVLFCKTNPWMKTEAKTTKSGVRMVKVPIEKPVTMMGFMVYCGIGENYWRNFRAKIALVDDLTQNFGAVLDYIAIVTRSQNIEGATVGTYNGNLIARLHGISDTINQNVIVDERRQVGELFPKKLKDPERKV